MQVKQHWENVYTSKAPERVSWYQAHADASLRLIRNTSVPLSASLIDVGGGASTLVDDLLRSGYESLTVLDVSSAEPHRTPFDTVQSFVYCRFRLEST